MLILGKNVFNPSERLTIGVDFHVKTVRVDKKKVKLQIWDVGGEERFRFLLPTYVLGANAGFLLYDITRSSTLNNLSEWTSIVRQKGGPIPIMLLGSKSDLANNQREVPIEHGVQIAEKNNFIDFAEISAKNNTNIDNVFLDLAKMAIQDIDQ